ncbi:MAG: hypothetical protein V1918_00975 [Planctomycetota bacterium]
MRSSHGLLLAAAFALGSFSGCDWLQELTRPPEPKKEAVPAKAPAPPERDYVRPEEQRQMGLRYDPEVFEKGAYRPDELKNMITSPGFDAIAQQTFAEAGGDFDVDVDRTGERMIFSTTRYGRNPEIVIQSIKGTAVTLFTGDPASDMMPKFNPDGTQVVWCSNRYGNWDLLLCPSDRTPNTRPQQLTQSTEDEIHPTWSPDGRMLAFSRYNAMDGLWRIWVLNLENRYLSAITEGLFPEFRPLVEPAAKGKTTYTLLYQKHRKRDIPWYSVWSIPIVMNADGAVEVAGPPTEIVANDQWAAINPCWSPDGEYVAFAAVRKSPVAQWEARIYKADDIWVVRRDGADLTQITSHAAPDWGPCWARDPESPARAGRLYFDSLRNGHENIWSVRPIIAGLVADQGAAPQAP